MHCIIQSSCGNSVWEVAKHWGHISIVGTVIIINGVSNTTTLIDFADSIE